MRLGGGQRGLMRRSKIPAPGALPLLTFVPPCDQVGKLLILNGVGLGVVLASLWQRMLIEPELVCFSGAIKKEDVGGN